VDHTLSALISSEDEMEKGQNPVSPEVLFDVWMFKDWNSYLLVSVLFSIE